MSAESCGVRRAPVIPCVSSRTNACACLLKECTNCALSSPPLGAPCSSGLVAPEPTTCCLVPKCQRLRVVVFCASPWSAIPGASRTSGCDPARVPNQPPANCQLPVTGGTPWPVTIKGKPCAYPVFDPLPLAIQSQYATSLNDYVSFVFDFGQRAVREAEGTIMGYGAGGCVEASLKFKYRWCGDQFCGTTQLPNFEVLKCRYKSARFTVLDSTSYISDDICTESIVILSVQQWCGVDETNPDDIGKGQVAWYQPCRQGSLSCPDKVGFLQYNCAGPKGCCNYGIARNAAACRTERWKQWLRARGAPA